MAKLTKAQAAVLMWVAGGNGYRSYESAEEIDHLERHGFIAPLAPDFSAPYRITPAGLALSEGGGNV